MKDDTYKVNQKMGIAEPKPYYVETKTNVGKFEKGVAKVNGEYKSQTEP